MSETAVLRTHLATRGHADPSHPPNLPKGYSLCQILEHMRICQSDYFRLCTDPDYTPPT